MVFMWWIKKSLFYWNVIWIINCSKYQTKIEKKRFLGLSVRGNPDKTPLTPSSFADPLWFASLCWRPLLSLFSEALRISLSLCSSLDIRLFTYAFSCSLLRSSRCILPILASFLTFLRVFLDWLYSFYLLLSLIALSLSFQPILLKTLLHELEL